MLVVEPFAIDGIDYSSTYCLHIAWAVFHHISNDLQLCWWAFFELFWTEFHLEISRISSSLNKRIRSQFVFIMPIFDQSFEAEIAEHCHISSVDNFLQKIEKFVCTFLKLLVDISFTTFPVQNHAVRIDVINRFHHSSGNLIHRFALKGMDHIFKVEWITSIDLHFGSF